MPKDAEIKTLPASNYEFQLVTNSQRADIFPVYAEIILKRTCFCTRINVRVHKFIHRTPWNSLSLKMGT